MKQTIRYSEAFKQTVVREVETGQSNCNQIRRKYGIKGAGVVENWVRKHGNGSLGKVIRVELPEEVNELARLRQRVKRLETLLADANIEGALDRAYVRIACAKAGIKDVEEFKKKAAGQLGMKP
jgi:transposase-like protein